MSALLKNAGKDLEQSWDIDVEAELETYLQQIEKIHEIDEDFDNKDSPQLNFIEAAFLLQSGTSVYGRKVEYLRSLTYQTLQQLSSHLGQDSATLTDSKQPITRKSNRINEDTLNIAYVPWDLLEKFECSANSITEKTYSSESTTFFRHPKDPSKNIIFPAKPVAIKNEAFANFSALLNPRNDRAETCISVSTMHPKSGYLILDHEDLYNFNIISNNQLEVQKDYSEFQTPKQIQNLNLDENNDVIMSQLHQESVNIPESVPFSVDFTENAESSVLSQTATKSRYKPEQDPLTFLDCNQAIGRDRPQVIGDTTAPLKCTDTLKSIQEIDPEQLLTLYALTNKGSFYSDIILRWGVDEKQLFEMNEEELQQLQEEEDTTKTVEEWMKKRKTKKYLHKFPGIELPRFTLMDEFGFGSQWISLESKFNETLKKMERDLLVKKKQARVDSELASVDVESYENAELAENAPDADLYPSLQPEDAELIENNEEEAEQNNLPIQADVENASPEADEDRASKMIDAQQAAFHSRMAKWRKNVEKWLEAINKRGLYDVSEYKEVIGSKLRNTEHAKFAQLLEKPDRSSVCRMFLTTLMMCYESTLNIKSQNIDEDGITKDFEVTFLKRHSNSLETEVPKKVNKRR